MADPAIKAKTAADRFTVEEYLEWALEDGGRHELHCGELIAMAPGRNVHNLTKGEVFVAFREAVKKASLEFTVFNDGVTVKTADDTSYEPDVTVQCGGDVDLQKMTADEPMIVVEVLSPSSIGVDTGAKLIGYMSVPSIHHVLIVDPNRRMVTHHRRVDDGFSTAIRGDGDVALDPPGLIVAVADFFIPERPKDTAKETDA